MSKITAFILSFIILFQSFSFDIDDFEKFPTLVNHIACHLNDGDSLADFITLHYGSSKNTHDQEHKEHKNLPFKHSHVDTHFQLTFIISMQNSSIKCLEFIAENPTFNYKDPAKQFVTINFFQPPKIA